MANPTEIVLHHLVVKGLADVPALRRCTGLDEADLRPVVARLVEQGHAIERTGRLAGFAPTSAGREVHSSVLGGDLLRARRDELAGWYERFERVNADLKELCTAWQLVDGERPNDHGDPAYDARILGGLSDLHARAAALLAEPGDPRLARYLTRLSDAAAAIAAGESQRFTSPLCESYHDVWMELHHDVLISFGRKRTAADA